MSTIDVWIQQKHIYLRLGSMDKPYSFLLSSFFQIKELIVNTGVQTRGENVDSDNLLMTNPDLQ